MKFSLLIKLIDSFFCLINRIIIHCRIRTIKSKMGYCGTNIHIGNPNYLLYPHLLYIYDNVNLNSGASFILSPFGNSDMGRFIMKRNSTAAQNLTIINHNHTTHPRCGVTYKSQSLAHDGDIVKDVVIEEDAFVGANVTICAGVVVGRGAIVGAGSVVRRSIPPYSIAYGNPVAVKRFMFTPEEIIEHEKQIYKEEDRYTMEEIVSFYDSY